LAPDGTIVGLAQSDKPFMDRVDGSINNFIAGSYYGTAQYPMSNGKIGGFLTGDTWYNYDIEIFDGTNIIASSHVQDELPFAGPITDIGKYYQVSGKYLAYTKLDVSGNLQVWIRDTAGSNKQVTYYNAGSFLIRPNEKGDVFFYNATNGGLNLALNGVVQPPKSYGSFASNNLAYKDSSWYLVEGRYLYKILVNAYKTVADGNWNDPSIWVGNVVPPDGADVIVTNNVTVNTNVTCNSLKVVYPAAVTVLPGFNITVLH